MKSPIVRNEAQHYKSHNRADPWFCQPAWFAILRDKRKFRFPYFHWKATASYVLISS